MKQLSIEEKAKSYDEALEKARQLCAYPTTKPFISDLQDLFPELKESGDEKIRKELIDYFSGSHATDTFRGIPWDRVVAWLEKQVPACLSHDDEIMIRQLIEYFTTGKGLQNTNDTVVEWFVDIKRKLEKQGQQKPVFEMKTPEESLGIDSDTYSKIVDECVYGEQKPADKVEQKFKVGDVIRRKDGDGLEWTVEDVHEDGYYTIVNSDRDDFIYLDDNWEIVNQKSTDKTEPKFKVGDWVVSLNDVYWHIDAINNNRCEASSTDGTCANWPLDTGLYHLWTIQDAKDGDVLAAHECLVLFKEIDGLNIRCYCTYHFMNNTSFYVDTLQNKEAFYPATKEQRELLFQKMKESGYEWDAEKLKLKTIEQKYDVSEKRFVQGDDRDKELSLSLQIQAYLNTASDELYASGKPLCSEKHIKDIHKCILMWKKLHDSYFNRIYTWSEEDEAMLNDIISDAEQGEDLDDVQINWLKSIKERYTWRPSDEQIT